VSAPEYALVTAKSKLRLQREFVLGIPNQLLFFPVPQETFSSGLHHPWDAISAVRLLISTSVASRSAKDEGLGTHKCPFANLPESEKGPWGEGLTAADMEKCVWLKPELVAAN
jgi:hypothetical protein